MTEQDYLDAVRAVCSRHGAARVVLFGSRARGSNAPTSGFDIAVYGLASTRSIEAELDALPTLFSADVLNRQTCGNEALKGAVEKDGIPV